jgi:hypothetical protein
MMAFDRTVFMLDATVDQAEFSGLLAGVGSLKRRWGDFVPEPGMLLMPSLRGRHFCSGVKNY